METVEMIVCEQCKTAIANGVVVRMPTDENCTHKYVPKIEEYTTESGVVVTKYSSEKES